MLKKDIILLTLFPLLAFIISLTIKANIFVSTLLFFGLPSIWLSLRSPKKILKTLIFALVISIPYGLVIDYIATLGKSWYVYGSVFPLRLLGVVPIESLIWGFLLVYFVVSFYVNFFEKGGDLIMSKKFTYLIFLTLFLTVFFFLIYFLRPEILIFSYSYFKIGFFLLFIPSLLFLTRYPKYARYFVLSSLYFFIVTFLFEIVGLHLGQWSFPGENYIGWVNLLGYRFPLEEFIFCFFMVTIAILSFYKYFYDSDIK